MTRPRKKLIDELRLQRASPSTEYSYVRAVFELARYYMQSPDKLIPEQIRQFILHLQVERKLAWSSVNLKMCGINFFCTRVLGWEKPIQGLPPMKRPVRPPEELSCEELERLFDAARKPWHRIILMTTYPAGLRVSEVARLHPSDILSDRMLIRVVEGKGNKTRYTTLSEPQLAELRRYWILVRTKQWLFPGRKPGRLMTKKSAQFAYTTARRRAGLTRGRGIHTLRHSFATHLLESGVDVRTTQVLLGHNSIKTTVVYLSVTRQRIGKVKSPFNLLRTAQAD